MPDVKGKEDLSDETQQVLAPRKWNNDVEGAWRMDINVEIVENTEEHEVMDLNDDGKGNGLESEIDLSGEEESEVKAVVTMNKIITSRFFYIIGSQIILLNQSSYGEDRVSSTWSNEYLLLENRQKSYHKAHSISQRAKKSTLTHPTDPFHSFFFTKIYIHHILI